MKLLKILVGWFILVLDFVALGLLTGIVGVIGLRFLGASPAVAIGGWVVLWGGMTVLGILANSQTVRGLMTGNLD